MHPDQTLPDTRSIAAGWTLHEYPLVDSTNDTARDLPAWQAVRADVQRTGRGRHDRSWVSDKGGLWLSAVVPVGTSEQGWQALPLAAGCAVCEALASLGLPDLRLRWPNDVMVRDRKVAGLLVDQFHPDRAVVGIGVNVTNHPEASDATLRSSATTLSEWLTTTPALQEVATRILERLRRVAGIMHQDGFAAVVPAVNDWWRPGVSMEIETENGCRRGVFNGIDAKGRLRLLHPDGAIFEWAAHQVFRARELNLSNS